MSKQTGQSSTGSAGRYFGNPAFLKGLTSQNCQSGCLVQAKTNGTLVKTLEMKDRELARMDLILSIRDSEIKVKEARIAELDKLKKIIAKHQDNIFTFLSNPAVPPTNNDFVKALNRPRLNWKSAGASAPRKDPGTMPPLPPSFKRRRGTDRTSLRSFGLLQPLRKRSFEYSIVIG